MIALDRRFRYAYFVAAGLILSQPAANAQITDYYWNAPTGGAGSWDTATQIWSSTTTGPVDHIWANSGSERANFGNTGGTVALSTGITAYGLNFTVAGYTISGNTLTLGTGAGAGVIDTGGVDATISSVVAGSVGLTKNSGGVLTLGGTNAFTGGITINGGVVAISSTNNFAPTDTGTLVINGTTFRDTSSGVGSTFINANHPIVIGSAGGATTGTIDIPNSAAILTYTPATNTTLITSANGSGTGTITKSGAGTLRLSSSTTTAALMNVQKLVVTGGLWQGGVDGIFGAAPSSALADQITLNGGGISSNAGLTLNANRGITIGASGGTINTSSSLTYSGKITGVGALTKTGASTLILGGATNDYVGGTTITAGTLQLTTGNDRLPTTGNLTLTGGTLDLNTRSQTINTLASSGGTGTITTTAASSPTLTVGNGNGSGTYSGIIQNGSGTVSLTKVGNGTQTLTGANIYTGATNVNGGTLMVAATTGGTGSLAAGSAVSVASGATLGGFGTVSGAVTVASGGFISPGASAGTLTIGTGSAVSGTYSWELATAGASAASNTGGSTAGGGSNDQLSDAGTLTLTGATLNITSLTGTGFNNTLPYSWQIATASALTGLPTLGTVSGTDFGTLNGGLFSIGTNGGNTAAYLNYTPSVPEPGTLVLTGVAAAVGLGWRRLRRGRRPMSGD
jgi:autotransporter-associated beta strand protein